jgi:hypothetical protein
MSLKMENAMDIDITDTPDDAVDIDMLDVAPTGPAWFVEMQYISAFHESTLLRTILAPKSIEKDIPFETRARDLVWARRNNGEAFTLVEYDECPQAIYNSWGINFPDAPAHAKLQPYTYEPLQSAKDHLIWGTLDIANIRYVVEPNIESEDKKISWYDCWHITNNPRLVGVGSKNIRTFLPEIPEDKVAQWDSYGVELISPIFGEADSLGSAQIGTVVNALTQNTQASRGRRAFVNNQCSLHVNVVVPRNDDARLLAIVTTIYEEEISRMHPVCRHPVNNGRHHPGIFYRAESNRLAFLKEPDLTSRPGVNGPPTNIDPTNPLTYGNVNASNREMQAKATIDQVKQTIAETQNRNELARLMNWPADKPPSKWALGHQERQMNFIRYAEHRGQPDDDEYPRVVQFRQAKGSLKAEDIVRWVTFCRDLVTLCGTMVRDDVDFPVIQWRESVRNGKINRAGCNISVFDLMNMMNYTDDQKEYWKLRMARIQCYVLGGPDDKTDIEPVSPGWTCRLTFPLSLII